MYKQKAEKHMTIQQMQDIKNRRVLQKHKCQFSQEKRQEDELTKTQLFKQKLLKNPQSIDEILYYGAFKTKINVINESHINDSISKIEQYSKQDRSYLVQNMNKSSFDIMNQSMKMPQIQKNQFQQTSYLQNYLQTSQYNDTSNLNKSYYIDKNLEIQKRKMTVGELQNLNYKKYMNNTQMEYSQFDSFLNNSTQKITQDNNRSILYQKNHINYNSVDTSIQKKPQLRDNHSIEIKNTTSQENQSFLKITDQNLQMKNKRNFLKLQQQLNQSVETKQNIQQDQLNNSLENKQNKLKDLKKKKNDINIDQKISYDFNKQLKTTDLSKQIDQNESKQQNSIKKNIKKKQLQEITQNNFKIIDLIHHKQYDELKDQSTLSIRKSQYQRKEMTIEDNQDLQIDNIQERTISMIIKDTFKNIESNPQITESLFIDDKVKQILSNIKNQEQAISFFAKYGNQTPVKFISCLRDDSFPDYEFRPYDLKVVKFDQAQKQSEHYQITPFGIAYLKKIIGQEFAESDIISFSTWVRESSLYKIMYKIPFFKNYCSSFKFLNRKNIGYMVKKDFIKNLLENKIKISKFIVIRQIILYLIIKIKYDFIQYAQVDELLYNCANNWEIEQFEIYLRQKRKLLKVAYEESSSKIQDQVQQARDQFKDQFEELYSQQQYYQSIKLKLPLNVLSKHKLEIKQKIHLLKKSESLFPKFINFLNYMLLITLKNANFLYMDLIESQINNNPNRHTGFFKINASFNPVKNYQLEIKPILLDLEECIKECFLDNLKVISNFYDDLVDKSFQIQIKGYGIYRQITHSQRYNKIINDILDEMKKNYNQVEDYVTNNYSKVQSIEQECYNNLETYKEFNKHSNKEYEIEAVKEMLIQNQTWEQQINITIKDTRFGMFYIVGQLIKNRLTKYIDQKTNYFKKFLYQYMRILSQATYDKQIYFLDLLQKKPIDLMEFSPFIQNTKDAQEYLTIFEKDELIVEQILQFLFRKIDAKLIQNSDNQQLEKIINNQNLIQNKISSSKSYISQKKVENQSKYDQSIQELNRDILNTQQQLYKGILIYENDDCEMKLVYSDYPKAKAVLADIEKQIQVLKDKDANLNNYQKLMALPTLNIIELQELIQRFNDKKLLWNNIQSFNEKSKDWKQLGFLAQNIPQLEQDMRYFESCNTTLKIKFNQEKFCNDKLIDHFIVEFRQISQYLPLISALGNQDMRPRHWKIIFELLDMKEPVENFSLQDLIEWNIMDKKEAIDDLSSRASGEALIESQLDNIRKKWQDLSFIVVNYMDQPGKFRITGIDEIMTIIDDNQVSIQTMMGTRFVQNIKDQVELWDKKLQLIGQTIDEWLAFQRNWMYLENIFSANDIQKQLPTEAGKFQIADKFWKEIMNKTKKNPIVQYCCNSEELLGQFENNNKILNEIQKCLEKYLEIKRLVFPRFYFLSNDELLQILSQSRKPHMVQSHLKKCFDNINRIQFTDEPDSVEIIAMISNEPERMPEQVQFFESVIIEYGEKTESWLMKIQMMMIKSLKKLAQDCLTNYPDKIEDRKTWLFFNYPSQIILLIENFKWQQNVTNAINLVQKQQDSIKNSVKLYEQILNQLVEIVRTELNILQRTLICTLLVIDVHLRDVIQLLINENVVDLEDFNWQTQLRYYYIEQLKDFEIKQSDNNLKYSYEYLGNGTRLVVTKLTDKCYLTMTRALKFIYGGSPSGPAGTGKTETVKDLSKALAIQCIKYKFKGIVFNCSDSLDYKFMGKFFSGLAQCGAWSCFDEFNRIGIEVLSVIAQQIKIIFSNLKGQQDSIIFEGCLMKLDSKFGFFVTMNPTYIGRTELPDNLKSVLRPIAMMIPDTNLIAEIIFLSDGFQQAQLLGKKIVSLYNLMQQLLSPQKHYDFGMRSLKQVLLLAGVLRRQNPDQDEIKIMIRSIEISNNPRFLQEDSLIFHSIVVDLFPDIKQDQKSYPDFENCLDQLLQEQHFDKIPTQVEKIIQLYETQQQRHGIMMVGQSYTSKSWIIEIFKQCIQQLHQLFPDNQDYMPVKMFKVNPKSVPYNNLYGYINLLTNDWNDGIIASLVREAVEDQTVNQKILIFDGPADAQWIESLNTVLDENKMLCLSNGQRIKLPQNFLLLFEVENLDQATPATVSRCGMIYVNPNLISTKAIINFWMYQFKKDVLNLQDLKVENNIINQTQKTVNQLDSFINDYFDQYLNTFKQYFYQSKPVVVHNMLTFIRIQLELLLQYFEVSNIKYLTLSEIELENYFQMILCYTIIWNIGSIFYDDEPNSSNQVFTQIKQKVSKIYLPFPLDGEIFDYYIDFKSKRFKQWKDIVPQFKFNTQTSFFQIIVPTVDTIKTKQIITDISQFNKNLLLIGDSGNGKTIIIKDFLNSQDAQKQQFVIINYSSQTSSFNLQDIFMDRDRFYKYKKDLIGPFREKKMTIYIDDLNLPQPDQYQSQPVNELLRQIIDHGGFYDLKKMFLIKIKDCSFISSCIPTKGQKTAVSSRLIRQFMILNMQNLSSRTLEKIYGNILNGFLAQKVELKETINIIVSVSVSIYLHLQKELLPTAKRSHYIFNTRDLQKLFQGILNFNPEQLKKNEDLIYLWIHEFQRVFYDRLNNFIDREFLLKLLIEYVNSQFQMEITKKEIIDIQFCNYLTKNKNYAQITNQADHAQFLQDQMVYYNMNIPKQISLVFFEEAIFNIVKISRILRLQRGNGLIIGVGGIGRSTLTRLGGYIKGLQPFEIEITKNYKELAWKDDLRKIVKQSGSKCVPTLFLMTDLQILRESFLEDINNIINIGEVPNLLVQEDFDEIFQDIRPLIKEKGITESRDNMIKLFIELVRQNLHIVLIFSPIGEKFRERCRQFPTIFNQCSIIIFDQWQSESLIQVALKEFNNQEQLGIGPFKDKLASLCLEIHNNVMAVSDQYKKLLNRIVYITPSNYLELLKMYLYILRLNTNILPMKIRKYQVGLQAIRDTKEEVSKLKINITEYQPELLKQQQENQVMKSELQIKTNQAEMTEQMVNREKEEAAKKQIEVSNLKEVCEREYNEAIPILQQAKSAVLQIEKQQLQIIKTYINPPLLVVQVLKACCLLFGYEENWENAKRYLLGDLHFLDKLVEYDVIKQNTEKRFVKLRTDYFTIEDFTKDKILKNSEAAANIFDWLKAIDIFQQVMKEVGPKEKKLQEAQDNLVNIENLLALKTQELDVIEKNVYDLNRKLQESEKLSESLEMKMNTAILQLERAEKLLGGLENESERWQINFVTLQENLKNLTGNILISSAFISYLSAFSQSYRKDCISKWLVKFTKANIPISNDFSLDKVLSDDSQLQKWQSFDLPSDQLSVQNAVVIYNCRKQPLIIDPQGQANKWIKKQEKLNGLKISQTNDFRFFRTLESCLQFGQPFLIENLQLDLDPILDPVLLKQTIKKGSSTFIKIGDTEISFNNDFRLFITSKLDNPHYLPDLLIKVTLINFAITQTGLEEQLLIEFVRIEKPELEIKINDLTLQLINDQDQLKTIEDNILKQIGEQQGKILDNDIVVNTLDQASLLYSKINQRIQQSQVTRDAINITREQYRVLAKRGCCLYFAIQEMQFVDPMYRWSLTNFIEKFRKRVQITEKNQNLEERLENLVKDMTIYFYGNICRGLYTKDKQFFAFIITTKIELQRGNIDAKIFQFFQSNNSFSENNLNVDCPDYIEPQIWEKIIQFCSLDQKFLIFLDSFETDKQNWIKFINSPKPQSVKVLDGVDISSFQRLILYKLIRQNRLLEFIDEYISQTIGDFLIERQSLDLKASFSDSDHLTPLIFLLTSGADPMQSFLDLSVQFKSQIKGEVQVLSLGQGQGEKASQLIVQGRQKGDWVFLENCHLSLSWLPNLLQLQESIEDTIINPYYRLWLSSMPTKEFPIAVLQSAVKMTNEPPKGIKSNIQGFYNNLDPETFDKNQDKFKILYFQLVLFHSIILERRKFGSIGWNVSYDWMRSDFEVSAIQIQIIFEENLKSIPFQALNIIISEINYGGRVTDDKDIRLIKSILQSLLNEQIFESDYQFCESYPKIQNYNVQDILQYSQNLSLYDDPSIFGLSQNSNIISQIKLTKDFLEILKITSPKTLNEDMDNDRFIQTITKIYNGLQNQIQNPFSFRNIDKKNSLELIRNQELQKYNVLIKVIDQCIKKLLSALNGQIVLTLDLEDILNQIAQNQLPSEWYQFSFSSEKPLSSWIEEFKKNYEFLKSWNIRNKMKSYLLSALMFPQSFMTAIKQNYSRKFQLPIDTIEFNVVLKGSEYAPNLNDPCINIQGLVIDGCRIDEELGQLADQIDKKMFYPISILQIYTVQKKDKIINNVYECPLYKISKRAEDGIKNNNFIDYLNLKSDRDNNYWIRHGVALIAQNPD